MAKADDTSSTIDWIWLRDALQVATKATGSQSLAKRGLEGLLVIGQLPWTCTLFEPGPATPPQLGSRLAAMMCFWHAPAHWIDWEDNSAGENVTGGAKAFGIKVSRSHLLAALPEESRADGREAGPQQRRALKVLKRLYPPDGKVPDDVSTGVVRGRVAEELAADSKNRELGAPSWDTINRALGRD